MNKQQAKQYRKPSWKERCRQIIELDGGTCQVCGRKEPDVVLQVHHKKYIQGKKPWEYNQQDLITLCKGCHAREHNILSDAIPQSGWKYEGVDDLASYIIHEEVFDKSMNTIYSIRIMMDTCRLDATVHVN